MGKGWSGIGPEEKGVLYTTVRGLDAPLVFSFYDTVNIKHFLRASVLAILSVVVADPQPCVNLTSYKTIQTSAAGVIYVYRCRSSHRFWSHEASSRATASSSTCR